MIDKLSSNLQFSQEALRLRAERHQVLAANVANADTPNFKARDFDFSRELASAIQRGRSDGAGLSMSATSERHLSGRMQAAPGVRDLLYRVPDQPSLDGNTVDMDRERAQFADNAVRYQASLSMINSRLQGLKTAMQPE